MPTISMSLTNAGHNFIRDLINSVDTATYYFALGSGTSTPTTSQTQLDTELFRKVLTSTSNGASTGEALLTCYISPSDAVGDNIQEVGIFGGTTATSTVNSGKMVGRALWAHGAKLSTESLQLVLDLIV